MKHKNNDNLKPEDINIDATIDSVMRKDAPASERRLTPCAADVKNKK